MNLLNRYNQFNNTIMRYNDYFSREVWKPRSPCFIVMNMTEEHKGIQPSVRLQTSVDVSLRMPAITAFLSRFNLQPGNAVQRSLLVHVMYSYLNLSTLTRGAGACMMAAYLYRTEGKEGMRDYLKAHRYDVCEFLSVSELLLSIGASIGICVGLIFLGSKISKTLV